MATQRGQRSRTGVRESATAWAPSAQPTYLLDINILLALLDPMHVFHDTAHRWFHAEGRVQWATSPLTENGVVRIASQPSYGNTPGAAPVVAKALSRLCSRPGHQFWQGDFSLLDETLFVREKLVGKHVTDSYLLALAVRHGGKLATFDRRLLADGVRGGAAALHLVE
ncbi:MAG: TA system VapC family ribonuclease toxin [Rhodanobacter sp.]